MTQHLETLKGILQHEFTKTHTSEDYVEAIADGIYSCQYETATPLKQWLESWEILDKPAPEFDVRYQQGVQFVAEQWDRVVSENSEGEGL